MTIARSIARSIARPIARGVGEGVGAADPRAALISALFGSGQDGRMYSARDLTQDTAGTNPVTTDSQVVARWTDLSGNDVHATQGSASNRGVYKTAGGLSWVESDGVNDRYDFTGLACGFIGIACRRIGDGPNSTAYAIAGSNQGISNGGTNASFDDVLAFDGTNAIQSGVDDTNTHVITVNCLGASGVLRVDGVEFSGTINPITVSRLFDRTDATFPFEGAIYAVVTSENPASTAQIEAAETWLASESGVTLP